MESDFIDEMVAKRAAENPEFPAMVKAAASARAATRATRIDAPALRTDCHDRRLARRLAEGAEFAAEYARQSDYLGQSGRSASEPTS